MCGWMFGAVVRCVPGVEWTEEESHSLHGGQEAEAEREEGGENLVPLSRMTLFLLTRT